VLLLRFDAPRLAVGRCSPLHGFLLLFGCRPWGLASELPGWPGEATVALQFNDSITLIDGHGNFG
jgi:hypothetical protein